ncbi:MAG: hypothetical protein RIT45_819, partial [Pseudomonadota bacterium]
VGLRANLRLQDGRPDEALDLLRSAREAMGRRSGDNAAAKDTAGPRPSTAITLRDGEVKVELRGAYADLLPGGLLVQKIALRLQPEAGIGEMSASIVGALKSELTASLEPARDAQPARVVGQFAPALRLPLPPVAGLPALADHVVLEGFDYDAEHGPSARDVSLLRGKAWAVKIASAGLQPGARGVRAGPIVVAPEAMRAALTLFGKAEAGGAEAGKAEGDGAAADAAEDDEAKADGDATTAKAKAKVAKPRKKGGKTKPEPTVAERLRVAMPTQPLTIAEIRAGSADGGAVRLELDGLSLALGGELGQATLGGASVTRAADGALDVEVREPALTLRWSQPLIEGLPGGAALWQAVERARQRPTLPGADDEDDDEDGDDVDRPDLAPEARKPRKTADKGKSARKKASKGGRPVSARAIGPLRDALDALTGLGPMVQAKLAPLGARPALAVRVQGAALNLLEPAAQAPLAGLRAGTLTLTRELGDGTRGLELSVETFGGAAAGESRLGLKLALAKGGTLDHAELAFSGGAFASAAATLGAAVTIGEGASLGGTLRVTADAAGEQARVEGKIEAIAVGIDWWRLSKVPVDGLSFSATMTLTADAKARALQLDLSPLTLGEAQARLLLEAKDIGPKASIHVRFEVPKQDCGKIAAAIPASLVPTLGKLEAKGELAADFDFVMPLAKPYKGKLDANLDDEACVDVRFEKVDLAEVAGDFSRPVNESGTLLEDQLIGPTSESWVSLADLPPWVPYAMMATEDAAFYHHRGLRLGLLSRAIKMNLDYGRFVYGGSTLTQQLVKNLYLTRDKYLGRKFEELLIVWHMERSLGEDKVKTKDRILELYCNAVEFAPHLYGIERAAQTYFGKSAKELSPLEVAFLAANKPHPKVGFRVFEQKKWTDWWQERMIGILRKMRADEIITEQQFVAEAPYVPKFLGWPAPEKPTADSTGAVGVGGVEE